LRLSIAQGTVLQDTEIAEGGKQTGIPRINRSHTLPLPFPSFPSLASPSYLPLAPHFPPSRGQTTTRDSVGFGCMNLSLRVSAPLLSPLCIAPDGFGICGGRASSWLIDLLQRGFSARNIRSCDSACFLRYPISGPTQMGVLYHSLRRAARHAVELYLLALPACSAQAGNNWSFALQTGRLSPLFPCPSTVNLPFVPIYTGSTCHSLSIPVSVFWGSLN
jgi:hypothetical protein